ncbi:COGs COG2929 [uncultured Candidatus Thioglobus sp.]|nr:COGs COG2929 [uncultured Candidatus Thioglobus sp.]
MEFEYDSNKNNVNKQKHSISFVEAQLLWSYKNALIVSAKRIENEVRYAIISTLKRKCFVAIFTVRQGKYRIISVRKCRKNEEKDYENHC